MFFAVGYRQIIKAVIDVHYFGDHVIGFLGDRAFGGTESDRFYKIGKRSSSMASASGNL